MLSSGALKGLATGGNGPHRVRVVSHNTLIHRFVRSGVRPLVHTPVAPNHLTTLRLLTGLSAGAILAVGTPAALAWGAGLFVLSMLLDRADGELARLSGKRSAFGHKYDLVADGLCNALVFIGLGVGLSDGPLEWRAIPMGVLAGLSVAAILFLVLHIEALQGERAAELGGAAGFDPDDGILFVPILIWFGLERELLAVAAVAAPAFAMFFYWKLLRKSARTGAAS